MNRGNVDVDHAPSASFGLSDDLRPHRGPWHAHRKHQILYTASGTLRLHTETSLWLLPPQRAAWISAGLRHRVDAHHEVALRTVYLDAAFPAPDGGGCRVFAVTPLAREMILETMRWGPARAPSAAAEVFFPALATLTVEWAQAALPFRLPAAKSAELARAMEHTLASLAAPSIEAAAKHAGLSVRTLNRRFADEVQTTWRAFVQQARLMLATELLSRPGARVTSTALEVGFESTAAFTRAFEAFVGEPPSEFKRRVEGRPLPVQGLTGP